MEKKGIITAVAVAGVIGAGALVGRRRLTSVVAAWGSNHDACEGDPTSLPDGAGFEVHASDGAVLRGLDCRPDDDDPPVVLLVHCWTGAMGNWAPVARRLVDDGFRVVLYDQRGHGTSDRGGAPYSPQTLGDDLGAVVEALDLRNVTIAGHSMGGLATMAYASGERFDAERVKALVLVATLASPPLPPRIPERGAMDLAPLLPALGRTMGHADLGLFGVLQVFGRHPARSQLEAARRGFLDTDVVTRGEAVTMMMRFDLRPALPSISTPTRIVAGTRDRLTWPHTNQAIADLIPDATVEFLPDRGHMLPWEDPEAVTEAIVDMAGA